MSFAGTPFTPQYLKIVMNPDAGGKNFDPSKMTTKQKKWLKACKRLGKSLTVGEGPWGMGVFKGFSCYDGKKYLGGHEGSENWTLKYVEHDSKTELDLFDQSVESTEPIAHVSFDGGSKSIMFFADQTFVDLLALRLLNELPVMGWLPKGAIKKSLERKTRSIYVPNSGKRLYKTAPPPISLTAFSAQKSGTFMLPTIKGKAVRSAFVEPSNSKPSGVVEEVKSDEADKKSQPKSLKFYATWTFDEATQSNSKVSGLWLHDTRGSGKLIEDLDVAIDDAANLLHEAIDEDLFATFLSGIIESSASGYIGVRYGAQTFYGDPLLKKSKVFGLVAEFRGGFLEGLRYNWDKVPSVQQATDGFDTSLEWSRHTIGRSFGLDLPFLVDRIEVTPKLGIWSLKAALIDQYNTDGSAAHLGTFEIDHGYNLGLEGGLEWFSRWYTMRVWTSYDTVLPAFHSVVQKKITSVRVGFDAFWTAGPVFHLLGLNLHSSILGFFTYDSITLSSSNTNPDLSDGTVEIVGLTMSSGFLGAGIGISW